MGSVVSAELFLDTVPSRDIHNVSACLQLNGPSVPRDQAPDGGLSFFRRGVCRVYDETTDVMKPYSTSDSEIMSDRERPGGAAVRRSSAGLGLFSTRDFAKGATVVEYVGERIPSRKMASRVNRYLFSVNSRWDIDGSPRYNVARYANHSCHPNCEAVNRGGRIFIVAKRRIRPGEELTYDYGREYFDEFIRPRGCRCKKCLKREGPVD